MAYILGLDIGSNSVGSAWIDTENGTITAGVSIFPAGVDESDEKRGEPKNAKRRMTRRTRITLARRAARKRELRKQLIRVGLLPSTEAEFRRLLEQTDPWELRRRGLDEPLSPYEFGRVLLHLAQRRGALGLKAIEGEEGEPPPGDDGKVKGAIRGVREKMTQRKARTFGEFMAMVRSDRVAPITSEDRRRPDRRIGPRVYRQAIRNKAGSYEHCADRTMIHEEFRTLWNTQKKFGSELALLLTEELLLRLDNEKGDETWRHQGSLFGQKRQSWDLGTLGRCNLEPTERCVPHADRYASRYLVVAMVNNLKIIEGGRPARPLKVEERQKILDYLSGPLGVKGKTRPKTTVSVGDLRVLMGTSEEGWGRSTKSSYYHFNIEADEDRTINTDWFSREIIHGAIGVEAWSKMDSSLQDGINHAILKFDPDLEEDAEKFRAGLLTWGGLSEPQTDALIAAWRRRPRPDAKRLNISRRAVKNLLQIMEQPSPNLDSRSSVPYQWPTEIEARKAIAHDPNFVDATTGQPLDELTRKRYLIGAKLATARDRHYLKKHLLRKDGELIYDPSGMPLSEPPPAPLLTNPVVRKAIHEVRRHVVDYLHRFEQKPNEVHVELMREARMGAKDADRLLFRNRLRNRIRKDIIAHFGLESQSSTQQRAAVDRVILCVQQGGESAVCPLCGKHEGLTPHTAAKGEGCEVAHILPRSAGGHNGLGNIVLAHTKCNRDMGRRTPREFWEKTLRGGFDEGIAGVANIYGEIQRPKPLETKNLSGLSLWKCYFSRRDDLAKIEQFKKDVRDITGDMTGAQEAATRYASRQVMSYLADSLYEGKGLPERGGDQLIFATDGLWTSRFRREWGLFFDPHQSRAKGLAPEAVQERQEKDRGDHRHHAIDAIVIALCSNSLKRQWDDRERRAEREGVNTADEVQMENYRRNNPIPPPAPFGTVETLRRLVRDAVYGGDSGERPICHRPVKRKLIGALHEETLFGPVIGADGSLTDNFTAKKSVYDLKPNHLRVPEGWDELSAQLEDPSLPMARAKAIRRELAQLKDPAPGKSGIVRDRALRDRIRKCLLAAGLELGTYNPRQNTVQGGFTANQLKRVIDAGGLTHASGVPIRSVVLLRTMSDPVVITRKRYDYATGKKAVDPDPASHRAYVGGNNHHIEIRSAPHRSGAERWSGIIVSAFEAANRKLAQLRAAKEAGIPDSKALRKMKKSERQQYRPQLREIAERFPIVDRRNDPAKGGNFVMSLCEGEMLYMKDKRDPNVVSYFVVAKLDKPQSIVVVPHWDARAAGLRKDVEGNVVPRSARESITLTPNDLKSLAPPGHPHAMKVRVSPLGDFTFLTGD